LVGPQTRELIFVVGPAVDGGGSFLVQLQDLGFKVGYALACLEKFAFDFWVGLLCIAAVWTAACCCRCCRHRLGG